MVVIGGLARGVTCWRSRQRTLIRPSSGDQMSVINYSWRNASPTDTLATSNIWLLHTDGAEATNRLKKSSRRESETRALGVICTRGMSSVSPRSMLQWLFFQRSCEGSSVGWDVCRWFGVRGKELSIYILASLAYGACRWERR